MSLVKTIRTAALNKGANNWAREDDEFIVCYDWAEDFVSEVEQDENVRIEEFSVKMLECLRSATEASTTTARVELKRSNQMLTGMASAFALTILVGLVVGSLTSLLFMGFPLVIAELACSVVLVVIAVRFVKLRDVAFNAGVWNARLTEVENLLVRLDTVKSHRARIARNRASVIKAMKETDLRQKPAEPKPAKQEQKTTAGPVLLPFEAAPGYEPVAPKKTVEESVQIIWAKQPDAQQSQAFAMLAKRLTHVG